MTHPGPWKPLNNKKKLKRYDNQICKEPGCDMKARCRNYCTLHYEQHRYKGDL